MLKKIYIWIKTNSFILNIAGFVLVIAYFVFNLFKKDKIILDTNKVFHTKKNPDETQILPATPELDKTLDAMDNSMNSK